MKRILFALVALLSAGLIFSACNSEFKPKKVKRVVVIGIDGMSVGGMLKANTPNFDQYMKEGAYSLHCRNIFPTVSSPNWAAMLMGSNATQTGVTSNDWEVDDYKLPPVLSTENGRYPDIFYVLKKSRPDLKIASLYDWGGFGRLYDHAFVDIDVDVQGGALATGLAIANTIKEEKPDFLFSHFDQVDHAGHADGHMTPKYLESIELADSLAAMVINASKEAGTFEETLFIITADHGGVGHGHGHLTVQGNEVPFILYGAGIKQGYRLPVEVNLMDLASTVAFAFDVPTPQAWVGRPVKDAFAGAPAPDPKTLVGSYLSDYNLTPVILPVHEDGTSGGLYLGEKAKVTIESEGKEGKIRYTTDGSIPTSTSNEYVGPFDLSASGVIRAAYFGDDGTHSTFAEGCFRVMEEVSDQTGITYKMYKGEGLNKIPAVAFLKQIKTGKVYEISTDELAGDMGEHVVVVFEGKITIPREGKYKLFITSDDGSKMYIDGKELIDNDGDHGAQEASGEVHLSAGKHDIKVSYFNGGGGYFLQAAIQGPGIPRQIISPEYLSVL